MCRNAARASPSESEAWPRRISPRSVCTRSPTRPSRRPSARPAPRTCVVHQQRKHELGARKAGRPQQRGDLATQAAAAHEHQPLAVLGELVGELHRHAAAERVPDERRPLMAEGDQQIADPVRVRAQRVVAARLGRLAVAQQIGGDDGEALGQVGEQRGPRGRGRRDAVDEHQHRATACRPVEEPVSVQRDLVQSSFARRSDIDREARTSRRGARDAPPSVAREGYARLTSSPRV